MNKKAGPKFRRLRQNKHAQILMTVIPRALVSQTDETHRENLDSGMPYRVYYFERYPITDPTERQIVKAAILRSLRTQYRRIKDTYGPPKAFKWVIW